MARKTRKWTNIKGLVPEVQEELSEREQKVRAARDERRTKTMKELAEEYQGLVEEEEFADLAAKERSIKYEALERCIGEELRKVEEISGQDTWRGEGQTFSPKIVVVPIVADREKLNQYIKDTGQEALLTLEYPRLKSLVTSALEELITMTPAQRAETSITLESPIPGVKIFTKTGVHRTKS